VPILESLPATVLVGPQSAMLKAVEAWLRATLGDKVQEPQGAIVGIHSSGRPKPSAGQFYFSVFSMGVTGGSKQANYLDNRYRLGVTLSVKGAVTTYDRQGLNVLAGGQQMYDAADWLCHEEGIHGNYGLMNAATALLGDSEDVRQGFCEPFYFASATHEEKGPDWWSSLGSGNPVAGFAVQMVFDNLRYIREKVV
jgi:hypothetical protein